MKEVVVTKDTFKHLKWDVEVKVEPYTPTCHCGCDCGYDCEIPEHNL